MVQKDETTYLLKAVENIEQGRNLVTINIDELPREVSTQADKVEPRDSSTKARSAFRALGKNAKAGKLLNAAVEHDRYLYGT